MSLMSLIRPFSEESRSSPRRLCDGRAFYIASSRSLSDLYRFTNRHCPPQWRRTLCGRGSRNDAGRYVLMFTSGPVTVWLPKLSGSNIMRMLVSSESIFDATMEFLDWRIYGFFFSFVNVMFAHYTSALPVPKC